MASHFIYKHLPASGVGIRPSSGTLRPYVTGGLGGVLHLLIIDDYVTGQLETVWAILPPNLGKWVLSEPHVAWMTYLGEGTWIVDDIEKVVDYVQVDPQIFKTTAINEVLKLAESDFIAVFYPPALKWVIVSEAVAKWEFGTVEGAWDMENFF